MMDWKNRDYKDLIFEERKFELAFFGGEKIQIAGAKKTSKRTAERRRKRRFESREY